MDKIGLILIWILIANPKATLAYATNQHTNQSSVATTIDKKSRQLNDPTMPKVAPVEETTDLKTKQSVKDENLKTINPSKLKLSMIIIKHDDRSAVINEKTVREKDLIAGYEITKIESNKVILKNPKNKEDHKKSKLHGSTDPEKPEPLEPDTFTELKLPSITIKSFFADATSNSNSPSSVPAAGKQ